MKSLPLPKEIRMGLGCMGMSQWYGVPDPAEAQATLLEAIDLGITYLDTAEAYGPYTNEELIGKTLQGRRDQAFIATKFGFPMIQSDGTNIPPDSSPQNIRKTVESSLKRLRTDYIDLLYQHRVDGVTPIEEVVGAMSQLVSEGKVRAIGLCEVGVDTIRKAHSVHPLTAVQAEYSLWERNLESDVIPVCHELGITPVAFCPLGRGYLTNKAPEPGKLRSDDFRKIDPRFSVVNFAKNEEIVRRISDLAKSINCTPAQLALSWILERPWRVVPIPGTKRRSYLRENFASLSLAPEKEVMTELNELVDKFVVHGDRYTPAMRKYIDR